MQPTAAGQPEKLGLDIGDFSIASTLDVVQDLVTRNEQGSPDIVKSLCHTKLLSCGYSASATSIEIGSSTKMPLVLGVMCIFRRKSLTLIN